MKYFIDNLRTIRLNTLSFAVNPPRRSSLPEYSTCQKELPKQNFKHNFKNKLYQIDEDQLAPPPPYPGI